MTATNNSAFKFQYNNNNLIQFFIYLRTYTTAQRPIIKQAREKTESNKHIHTNKDKQRQFGQ
jgi:hypothetical protein